MLVLTVAPQGWRCWTCCEGLCALCGKKCSAGIVYCFKPDELCASAIQHNFIFIFLHLHPRPKPKPLGCTVILDDGLKGFYAPINNCVILIVIYSSMNLHFAASLNGGVALLPSLVCSLRGWIARCIPQLHFYQQMDSFSPFLVCLSN